MNYRFVKKEEQDAPTKYWIEEYKGGDVWENIGGETTDKEEAERAYDYYLRTSECMQQTLPDRIENAPPGISIQKQNGRAEKDLITVKALIDNYNFWEGEIIKARQQQRESHAQITRLCKEHPEWLENDGLIQSESGHVIQAPPLIILKRDTEEA